MLLSFFSLLFVSGTLSLTLRGGGLGNLATHSEAQECVFDRNGLHFSTVHKLR